QHHHETNKTLQHRETPFFLAHTDYRHSTRNPNGYTNTIWGKMAFEIIQKTITITFQKYHTQPSLSIDAEHIKLMQRESAALLMSAASPADKDRLDPKQRKGKIYHGEATS
ncbi:hypothetical protein, partial [Caldilinea sp.]|uniref:hypothetical protein n=1 Tax=Caldilinea sp. TaxID=2293560 RepID=UPI002BE31DF8|nr:hypothetical protein [Caldilinea sp.]